MLHIVVKIQVKNFDALEKYEQQAAIIMRDYQGEIITAIETTRNMDNSGEEIHLLGFQNTTQFENYRLDTRLLQLASLREQAISSLEINTSSVIKHYSRLK